MNDLLVCQNLSKCYLDNGIETHVLKGVNLRLQAAEMLAIIGSSGSGKSTLLHLMGALDMPSEGEVLFEGQDIFALSTSAQGQMRNQKMGFVYQFHHLLGEFDALENVAMPLLIGGEKASVAKRKAAAMIDAVGLGHRQHHRPSELSGGERQRIAIARAMVTRPRLLLADEPTGNLDQHTGEAIYQLMLELNREFATAFVVVTHDLGLAQRLHRQTRLIEGVLTEASA